MDYPGVFPVVAAGVVIGAGLLLQRRQQVDVEVSAEALRSLKCEGNPFAPDRPDAQALQNAATKTGPLLCVGPLVVQRACFNALWIRVGAAGCKVPSKSQLRKVIEAALEAQSSPKKAALYVAISDSCLSQGTLDMAYLRQCGFVFHHYRPAVGDSLGEAVHVADLAKMVPSYATSIEGVTGIVFSPDGEKVLGVWEHTRPNWNTPGGAVDEGENKFEALSREVSEEVGVTLDPAFPPAYLGGWQKGRARDGRMNDNFSVFAVRASSDSFQIDNKEIVEARWLPWRQLLDEWVKAGKPTEGKAVPLTHSSLPADKKLVSKNILKWLDSYKSSRTMACKLDGRSVVIG